MRYVKRLGLVAVAAMALAAFGASSASASGFVADKYPVSLVGANTTSHSLTTNIGEISCSSATFMGTLTESSETATVSPQLSNCVLMGTKVAIVFNYKNCQYTLDPGTNQSGTFAGTLDIAPAGCGPISFSIPGCTVTIPSQNDLATVSYSNSGSGSGQHIVANASLSGIKYTTSGFFCGSGTFTNGTYKGSWKVSGFGPEGNSVGVRVVERLPVGIFVTGSEAEKGTNPPRLDAESFPVVLSGTQVAGSEHKFVTDPGTVRCTTAKLAGEEAAATAEVDLTPSYSGCTIYTIFGNIAANAIVNGCEQVYTVAGSGPYSGKVTLSCPAGQSLKISGPGCTIQIPAQSLGTVSYENTGAGENRSVRMSVSGSSISYTYSGFTCGSGSGANGTFSGATLLSGGE